MNAKQSLRFASKRIEELEHSIRLYVLDVRAYNKVIDCLIAGGSACGWCDDEAECDKDGKGTCRGCDEWMLRMNKGDEINGAEIKLYPADVDFAAGVDGTGSEIGGNGVDGVPAGVIDQHQEESIRKE